MMYVFSESNELHPIPQTYEIEELDSFKKAKKRHGLTEEDLLELKVELKRRKPEGSYGASLYKFRWCPKRFNLGAGEARVLYTEVLVADKAYLLTLYFKKDIKELPPKVIKEYKEAVKRLRNTISKQSNGGKR